jgi:hypothetical protein
MKKSWFHCLSIMKAGFMAVPASAVTFPCKNTLHMTIFKYAGLLSDSNKTTSLVHFMFFYLKAATTMASISSASSEVIGLAH